MSDDYELLDFGAGRKLERFGQYLLDRVAPAAANDRMHKPDLWARADARYEREASEQGRWVMSRTIDQPWRVWLGGAQFELKLTPFGHVGIFPEQACNWDWVARQIPAAGRPVRVLNLFAHTGGSTLAAAAAGASVTHVDAAANVVAWARRNAGLSGLSQAPVRWITEDALKFAERELKRGRRYEAVILDPPTYGHGPKGEVWKFADQIEQLLSICFELTAEHREFILLTCHSQDFAIDSWRAKHTMQASTHAAGKDNLEASEIRLDLVTAAGERLCCGAGMRWGRREEEQAAGQRNRS